MYVESVYKYFQDFRMLAKGSTNEIVIADELIGVSNSAKRDKSPRLFSITSLSINTKREAFGPLPDPTMGLREGKGARREG
jgi:hypothetical protein